MSRLLKTYLLAYNGACALGWGYLLYLTAVAYTSAVPPSTLWATLALPLTVVQTAAVLEVLHALLGLVNAPVGPTAAQVASRLLLVWGYTRVEVKYRAPLGGSVEFSAQT